MPPSLPPLQPLNPAAGSSPLSPPYSASQSPMVSPVNNFYPPVMGAPVGMVPTVPAVGLSPQIPQSVMMPAQMSSLPPNSMLYPITFMSNGIIPQVSLLVQ